MFSSPVMMEIWQELSKVTAGWLLRNMLLMFTLVKKCLSLCALLIIRNKHKFVYFLMATELLWGYADEPFGCSVLGIVAFARPSYWTGQNLLNFWIISKEVHCPGMNSLLLWRRRTRIAWANPQTEGPSLASPRKRTISMLIPKNVSVPVPWGD